MWLSTGGSGEEGKPPPAPTTVPAWGQGTRGTRQKRCVASAEAIGKPSETSGAITAPGTEDSGNEGRRSWKGAYMSASWPSVDRRCGAESSVSNGLCSDPRAGPAGGPALGLRHELRRIRNGRSLWVGFGWVPRSCSISLCRMSTPSCVTDTAEAILSCRVPIQPGKTPPVRSARKSRCWPPSRRLVRLDRQDRSRDERQGDGPTCRVAASRTSKVS